MPQTVNTLAGFAAFSAAALGLIALLAMRRRLPSLLAGFAAREGRRIGVIEVLPLHSGRHLVLVRCDGREALLVAGGAAPETVIGWTGGAEGAARDGLCRCPERRAEAAPSAPAAA